MQKIIVGIAWYQESEWKEFRLRMADPEIFNYSYGEWIIGAQKTMQKLENEGIIVRKTPIPIDDFLSWCEKNRRRPDGSARSAYVAEKTKENEDQRTRRSS